MKVYQFPENATNHGTYAMMVSDLLDTEPVHTGEWQAMDTSGSALHATHELEDSTLYWERMPQMSGAHQMVPHVDHTWAAEHFAERVSGIPWNPAPSHLRWPYAVRGNADHTTDTKFDHTYPERFWPGFAGAPDGRGGDMKSNPHDGIRFPYGDLDDVVELLIRSPLTRQAYLPVWFPEDTGAHKKGESIRVPCTLGYHFMQRGGRLSCRYYLRSCDVYRHLSNDVYFAAMLTNWVANQVSERTSNAIHFRPGSLSMHISSLHAFVADVPRIQDRIKNLMPEHRLGGV